MVAPRKRRRAPTFLEPHARPRTPQHRQFRVDAGDLSPPCTAAFRVQLNIQLTDATTSKPRARLLNHNSAISPVARRQICAHRPRFESRRGKGSAFLPNFHHTSLGPPVIHGEGPVSTHMLPRMRHGGTGPAVSGTTALCAEWKSPRDLSVVVFCHEQVPGKIAEQTLFFKCT